MSVLTALGVQDAYEQLIPNAANHSENYLRNVAKLVQEQELPVEMGLEDHATGFWKSIRGQGRQFLAITPGGRGMGNLKMLHFGFPIGKNLSTGWLLVGTISNLDIFESADLNAVIGSVHQFAVFPALQAIADDVRFDRAELKKRSVGFFGV